MQIYEIYFKSIYNECVIYVLLTVFIVKGATLNQSSLPSTPPDVWAEVPRETPNNNNKVSFLIL